MSRLPLPDAALARVATGEACYGLRMHHALSDFHWIILDRWWWIMVWLQGSYNESLIEGRHLRLLTPEFLMVLRCGGRQPILTSLIMFGISWLTRAAEQPVDWICFWSVWHPSFSACLKEALFDQTCLWSRLLRHLVALLIVLHFLWPIDNLGPMPLQRLERKSLKKRAESQQGIWKEGMKQIWWPTVWPKFLKAH